MKWHRASRVYGQTRYVKREAAVTPNPINHPIFGRQKRLYSYPVVHATSILPWTLGLGFIQAVTFCYFYK